MFSLPPSPTVAMCRLRSRTSTSASVSIWRRHHLARSIHTEPGNAGTFAHHLERHLLEIKDDVGCVFHDARDRAEFVRDAFDAHGRNRRAFDGAEQHAAQAGADSGSESTLERLGRELSEALGKRLRVRD